MYDNDDEKLISVSSEFLFRYTGISDNDDDEKIFEK
jgi:hypothetical protein